MSKGIVYVYDPASGKMVERAEYERRQAARAPKKMARPDFLPDEPQRGHWIYDRELHKAIPADEFYARHPMQRAGQGLQIIPDMKPFVSPVDNKVVGGRAQRREHMKRHDLIEVGNERLPKQDIGPRPGEVKRAMVDAWKQVHGGRMGY